MIASGDAQTPRTVMPSRFDLRAFLIIAFIHQRVIALGVSLQGVGTLTRTTTSRCHRCRAFGNLRFHRRDESADKCTADDLYVDLGRRKIFTTIALSSALFPLLLSPPVTYAAAAIDLNNPSTGTTRPFAATEALQPAIRVKLCIDRATKLANKLIDNPSIDSAALVQELENLIIQPQDYLKYFKIQGVPKKPAKQYLEAYKPMAGDLPFQRYLIKNGDVSAWKDLKKKEKEQEGTNELRAALNAYTDVLSFSGDSYLLNVDKATRSNMVRQDRLPDVKQVITSDMGMRYLYRNQILTAMDDVRAELKYQIRTAKSLETTIDAVELLNLLEEAQKACDRWLSLIDPGDVLEAIKSVELDG